VTSENLNVEKNPIQISEAGRKRNTKRQIGAKGRKNKLTLPYCRTYRWIGNAERKRQIIVWLTFAYTAIESL